MPNPTPLSRRHLLRLTGGAALFAVVPAGAAPFVPTPRQTEGPFYPLELPLDSDNDLVQVAGRPERAKGTVLHLTGRVLDAAGRGVVDARIEIWQADANGVYAHPRDRGERDPNFQGYGRTIAAAGGAWRFRTIRPVPYGNRTPHIHFSVSGPGFERLVTQMYVAGEPLNATDPVLNRITDPAARASVIIPLEPAPEIEDGAVKAHFDIVLGHNAVVPA